MRNEPLMLTGALITADEHTAPAPILHVADGVVEAAVLGMLNEEDGEGTVVAGGV